MPSSPILLILLQLPSLHALEAEDDKGITMEATKDAREMRDDGERNDSDTDGDEDGCKRTDAATKAVFAKCLIIVSL